MALPWQDELEDGLRFSGMCRGLARWVEAAAVLNAIEAEGVEIVAEYLGVSVRTAYRMAARAR